MGQQQVPGHYELVARYGKPEVASRSEVLALLHRAGAAAGLTADDVVAFRYPGVEAAEAFAASNWARHGMPAHYTVTAEGVFGVVDLRPAIRPAPGVTGKGSPVTLGGPLGA